MILLLLAVLTVLALVVVTFLNIGPKLYVLSGCVIALVLLNLLNEIQAISDNHSTPSVTSAHSHLPPHMNHLPLHQWEELEDGAAERMRRELMEEER